MGEPIIIWPPDGGNFTDFGDYFSSACQNALDTYEVEDCSAQYEANTGTLGDGLACCGVE